MDTLAIGTLAMESSAILRILVGPYGLHAFGLVLLSFFIVFLWVFNFTNFLLTMNAGAAPATCAQKSLLLSS
jgi:hypothetical protein